MDKDISSRWQQPHCQCCLGANCLENFSTDNSYEDMLWNVFSIFVTDLRGKQICMSCVQSLRDADNFKAQVLKSQQILQTTGQHVKHEAEAAEVSIQIKREDCSDDGEEGDNLFEVPGTNAIKMEASTQLARAEARLPSDSAGGGKRRAVTRRCAKKPAKEISTEASRDGAVLPDIAAEAEKTKNDKEITTAPAPKKRKRRTLRPEYEALKSTDIALATNSNMTLFRWSRFLIKCLFCEDTFQDTTLLKQHTLTHRQDLAEKINRNKQNRHIRADVTDLKCGQCQHDIKDITELKLHLDATHHVRFPTHKSLLIPFKLDELACVECGQKFETFAPLDTHMNTHYSKSVCDKCGKHFRTIGKLRDHLRTHTDIVYNCKLCEATFDTYYGKQKHAKEKHGVAAGHKCPHCNEDFLSIYTKKEHLIKEHGYQKSEFKCKLCDKVYGHKVLLSVHVRSVHLQEKNFECDVCHYGFMRKSDLKNHMKYHENIRAFSCSFCTKEFVKRNHLNRHMATHDESYKHTCPHCGGSYTQKYYMKLHMKKCSGTNKRAKVAEDGVQLGVEPL